MPLSKGVLELDKIPPYELEPIGYSPDFLRPIPSSLEIQPDEVIHLYDYLSTYG